MKPMINHISQQKHAAAHGSSPQNTSLVELSFIAIKKKGRLTIYSLINDDVSCLLLL